MYEPIDPLAGPIIDLNLTLMGDLLMLVCTLLSKVLVAHLIEDEEKEGSTLQPDIVGIEVLVEIVPA
jgi:hypothetical protein